MTETAQGDYAPVNGLQMYYEVHGTGDLSPLGRGWREAPGEGVPLVLLHGAFSTIETDFGKMLPTLAKTRQVIGVEQQAHGHTADIDRPLSYPQMADDTAALLQHLGIDQADIFAYSFGSAIAMELARHHPSLVRKLALFGGVGYRPEGYYPELRSMLESF